MAKIHNLPPQAYTRDVLIKAIDWVATQSPAVRERAMSADALVSLYLQSKRRSNEWHQETVSTGEHFKSDLKHLAQDLKQFQFDEPLPPQHTFQQPEPTVPAPAPPPPRAPIVEQMSHQNGPDSQSSIATPKALTWTVDPKTLSAARELQTRLNIGSDVDALRMLVTLGIERARGLFPS
jgi:hypothetical protein